MPRRPLARFVLSVNCSVALCKYILAQALLAVKLKIEIIDAKKKGGMKKADEVVGEPCCLCNEGA